jgi:flavin reductase (DIM6/NTAB) family NADH-FMN oxidoreductase RutF
VWLSKANHTYRVGLRAAHFTVHFLTADDLALAERFGTLTGADTDKFAGMDVEPDQNGVPRLTACQNWMSLERIASSAAVA